MVAPNTPLTTDEYVVVLKCKVGELHAIRPVPRSHLVPLVEALSSSQAGALARALGTTDVSWVQPLNAEGLDDPDWASEVGALFDQLRADSVIAVPVVTTEELPNLLAEVHRTISVDQRGIVLRLDVEDILTVSPTVLQGEIDDLLAALGGLSPAEVDLILDASFIRDSVAARVASVESAKNGLPYVADWRSLVVAMSAFPTPLGDHIPKNSVSAIPRQDRDAYLTIRLRNTGRPLTYGDFAVGQPDYGGAPFAAIPNIKYTGVSEWLVHRADSRNNPSPQYIALASALAAAPHFRGPGFSEGDAYISAVSSGTDGPGNATTYVRVATSHHVHHVLDRLATHGEP